MDPAAAAVSSLEPTTHGIALPEVLRCRPNVAETIDRVAAQRQLLRGVCHWLTKAAKPKWGVAIGETYETKNA